MAQYWLQVPIENAKEVALRKLKKLAPATYSSKTLRYSEESEVILHRALELSSAFSESNNIYFGTFYIGDHQHETDLKVDIFDGTTGILTTFDGGAASATSGAYPYILWNRLVTIPKDPNCYFVGYKFDII